MKKNILLIVALTFFTFVSHAQIKIGATAGLNVTSISSDMLDHRLDDNLIGFYVGPTAEWLIDGKFGFDLSLLYSMKGIEFEGEDAHNIGYIEVPLNVKYLFPVYDNVRVFAGAGPYINFRVSGDKEFYVRWDDVNEQWKTKSFGTGLNFKGGVEMYKFIQAGVEYTMSLVDNFKSDDGLFSGKERVWSVYVAAYF